MTNIQSLNSKIAAKDKIFRVAIVTLGLSLQTPFAIAQGYSGGGRTNIYNSNTTPGGGSSNGGSGVGGYSGSGNSGGSGTGGSSGNSSAGNGTEILLQFGKGECILANALVNTMSGVGFGYQCTVLPNQKVAIESTATATVKVGKDNNTKMNLSALGIDLSGTATVGLQGEGVITIHISTGGKVYNVGSCSGELKEDGIVTLKPEIKFSGTASVGSVMSGEVKVKFLEGSHNSNDSFSTSVDISDAPDGYVKEVKIVGGVTTVDALNAELKDAISDLVKWGKTHIAAQAKANMVSKNIKAMWKATNTNKTSTLVWNWIKDGLDRQNRTEMLGGLPRGCKW